jgi:GAF domain-containing protein
VETLPRIDRGVAKLLLFKVDSAVTSKSGREAREEVVKLLNREVPTYSWVGIYLLHGNELVLDAWSGPQPTTHTRISIGKGVCGWAAKTGRTEIVSDVSKDPRYLQCFANTRSEIVVPVVFQSKVVGEIDIDGDVLNAFSTLDKEFLEAIASKIAKVCTN